MSQRRMPSYSAVGVAAGIGHAVVAAMAVAAVDDAELASRRLVRTYRLAKHDLVTLLLEVKGVVKAGSAVRRVSLPIYHLFLHGTWYLPFAKEAVQACGGVDFVAGG
jgi:hypothetical protein